MATGNRQPFKNRPVAPSAKQTQSVPPTQGGAAQQQATSNQPPVETKENPSTIEQPEEMETKEQASPAATPETAGSHSLVAASDNPDWYHDAFGHRVIRVGRPITIEAKKVGNRMIVTRTVLQEVPLQGTKKLGKHQVFFRGQEISETMLRQVGARQA